MIYKKDKIFCNNLLGVLNSMRSIQISNLAQIESAQIELGDMTLLTGPQATGKSIFIQLLKLIEDANNIAKSIKRYGYDWDHIWEQFLELYFGEGMSGIWQDDTKISIDGVDLTKDDIEKEIYKTGKPKKEKIFLIPAQRVLTLKGGWPRNFGDYDSTDPYVVKEFSENIRRLMESGVGKGEKPIFPHDGRLRAVFREKIDNSIFNGATVRLDKSGFRKRIVLDIDGNKLPFMVWSAGQREFIPLLIGLYWLLPSSKATKKESIEYIIIEEAEMGLHPNAITSLVLLFLELISRGYKVILSTHSPTILDVVWSIRSIKECRADPTLLIKLFNLPNSSDIKKLCKEIIDNKEFNSYYFDKQKSGKVIVKDISTLDPASDDPIISGWGGLTQFSGVAGDIVAEAINMGECDEL